MAMTRVQVLERHIVLVARRPKIHSYVSREEPNDDVGS
jgi:hypothetical protein